MDKERKPWKPKEIDWTPLKEFINRKLSSQDEHEKKHGETIRAALEALDFLGKKEIEARKPSDTPKGFWIHYFFDVVLPFNSYLKEVAEGKRSRSSKIENKFWKKCISMQLVIKESFLPKLNSKWPYISKIVQQRRNRKRPA